MRSLSLSLLLLIGSCVPKPPIPPLPPPVRTVAIVATGATTGSAYVDDTGGGHTCVLQNGYCEVTQHDAPAGQTFVTVQADGFDPYRQDAITLPPGNTQLWLGPGCGMPSPTQCVNLPPLTPTFHPLPRLLTRQWYFVQDNGQPITLIGADSYALYQMFLANQDITPIVDQLQSLGFNYLRVFGSYNGALGHFVPTELGDAYFQRQPAFAQLLATRGFYYEHVVFADATTWIPDIPHQLGHYQREIDTLAPITNALVEAGNELDQKINTLLSTQQLPMPTFTNASHGSNGSGSWGVSPFWHYTSLHVNLESEWQRKYSHNCYEIGWLVPAPNNWRGPCIGEEHPRPDQDSNIQHFQDAGAACTLLNAGCVFHSNTGKGSQLLIGMDLAAAQAFVQGMRSVPLACQSQDYRRLDPAPGMLRTYQRGNDPACIVNVRQ